MSERRHSREIPEGLVWLVDKLIELHARGFLGNVSVAMKAEASPVVKVEETFRDTSPGLPWVEVKK